MGGSNFSLGPSLRHLPYIRSFPRNPEAGFGFFGPDLRHVALSMGHFCEIQGLDLVFSANT